jgi:hypothetical protein
MFLPVNERSNRRLVILCLKESCLLLPVGDGVKLPRFSRVVDGSVAHLVGVRVGDFLVEVLCVIPAKTRVYDSYTYLLTSLIV